MDPETETYSPAVERAAELLIHEAETTGLITEDVRNGLAAALDVEEMGREAGKHLTFFWSNSDGVYRCDCGQRIAEVAGDVHRSYATHIATSLRTAILGADS